MAHRTKEGQKTQDLKVAAIAQRLERLGYNVKADLPGHQKPPAIRGHIPDVLATKRSQRLIREIETRGTVASDKNQHRAFRQYAKEKQADFRVLMARKGRR